MNRYNSDDELKHYGVLGMKWGQRKGRSYISRGTLRLEKRASNIEKRYGKKAAVTAKKAAQIARQKDEVLDNYTRRQGLGKAAVKTLLLSPLGDRAYNYRRASGYGRLSSFAASIAANAGGIVIPVRGVKKVFYDNWGVDEKRYKKKLNRK